MILGIDTSTGTAVALVSADGAVLAERFRAGARGHAEAIGPLLAEVLREAGAAVERVAVGMGPGPYTGLRVGIAAALAFAAGRGVPVHGVPSHDAIREELGLDAGAAVATSAGRRGHYVSQAGLTRLTHDGVGGALLVDAVSAAAVARVALERLAAGVPTGPSAPMYLRAPDVTPSAGPKRVTG